MQRLRILIVDDDPDISGFIKLKLSKDAPHFSIAHVESGQECLDYLDKNEVDCILSDYQLPGMNGMELLMELRARRSFIPLIFITGQGSEEVAREAFKAGAFDYFTKDIGFAHFARIKNSIEQAVRKRESESGRREAEAALREEKNKFEAILACMADGIGIQDKSFKILYQNPAQKKLMGDHVGRYCYEAYHGRDSICENCQVAMAFIDGKSHTVERSFVMDGVPLHVEVTASPLRDSSGKIVACIESVRDITMRRLAERRFAHLNRLYSIISHTNKAMLRTTSRIKLMEEACRIAVEQGQFRMAWVGFADTAGGAVRPVASWGAVEGYLDEIRVSSGDEPEGRGPVGRAIRSGVPFVVNDIESDPDMAPWRERALRRGYRSLAAFPIKAEEGVIGAFAVYSGEPGMFDEEETSLMEGLAADISFALRSIEKDAQRRIAEEAARESEALLLESEQRYKDLVELSTDFIYRSDRYGNQTFMNDAAYRILDASREDVVGQPWEKWIHPEDRERTIRCFMEMVERGIDAFNFENRFVSKTGRLINVLHNVRVLRDETGAIIGTQGIARDITERRAAEEALRESELLFRSLVEESIAGVYIIQDGRFSYVNPRAAEMFGYTQEEVVNGLEVLDLVHPDDRELIEGNLRDAFSGELKPPGVQFRGVRKDGSILEVEAFGAITAYNGMPAVIGTALDITDRKRSEEEKNAMFHMLTHDIKGPLSVIYGYCDMVGQLTGVDAADMAGEIQKAARRISALIDDMLALSRLEAKEAALVIRPVSIVHILRQAMRDNEALAAEKGISMAMEADPALPMVHADSAQLTRAFSNLVANAVHYNKKGGGVLLKAAVDASVDGGRVVVAVMDDGDGIAPEDMPHIFDKYYRGKRANKKRGTGLGLAIVKAAVDAHGGKVSAESVKGKGSTFIVVLPLKK